MSFNNCLNASPFATKSVSQLISKIIALLPLVLTIVKPSAAIRVADFLAAFAIPFSRNQSQAFSMSRLLSSKAFLQSIIPAPVRSLKILMHSIIVGAAIVITP